MPLASASRHTVIHPAPVTCEDALRSSHRYVDTCHAIDQDDDKTAEPPFTWVQAHMQSCLGCTSWSVNNTTALVRVPTCIAVGWTLSLQQPAYAHTYTINPTPKAISLYETGLRLQARHAL